jgi:hypothetical protein
MKSNVEPIKVYWAATNDDDFPRWNMMYTDPEPVIGDQMKNRNSAAHWSDNYLQCPAYRSIAGNMYSLITPISSEYEYQHSPNPAEKGTLTHRSKNFINGMVVRPPTVNGAPLVRLSMVWLMFAEEPLLMEFLPPFLHKTESSKYGAIIPGQYDIGQWFRGINPEFQLWDGETTLKVEEGEPLAYVRFITDRPVELVRFTMTQQLRDLADSCSGSPSTFGVLKPLKDRYRRFMGTKSNNVALKYIKENLI